MSNAIPATMNAIVVADDADKTLRWASAPVPAIAAGEVLVRIHASAVNRADLLQRIGRYPVPEGATEIMGLEAAGEVVALGQSVSGVSIGDRVCVLLEGGGYAEYVNADARMLLPVPETMSWTDAASLPEVVYTAFLNIWLDGGAKPGDTVLIHAGGSGVGTAAIQLCRALGHRCFATASGGKLEALTALGADVVIDRNEASFKEVIRAQLGRRGVDVILDPVGGSYLADNQAVLAKRGRLVIIGLLGGASAELNIGRLLMNRQQVIGSVLRSRSRDEKVAITQALRQRAWPLVTDGRVVPVVHHSVAIQDVAEAHAVLKRNENVGKVVLRVRDEA